MPRRGENIYKRKDGRWEGRVQKKDSACGKRCYKSIYGKTYREVKLKLEKEKISQAQVDIKFPNMQEAAAIWIEDREKYWKPTTSSIYMQILNKYIVYYLGHMKINTITTKILEDFVITLMNKRENLLSLNYLSYICAIVIRILTYINKRNAYELVLPDNPISKNRKSPIILPSEHALSVLEKYLISNKTNVNLGILIAFYTGIRICELCALKWSDIDWTDETIHIKRNIQRVQNQSADKAKTKIIIQEPKTVDSVRVVPIPPILLPLLKESQGENSHYIVKGTKQPWADPRTVQYQFKKSLEICGLEHFKFHMLRHSFASRCIAKGFDIKSLSEILGHSDVHLTLNLYVHSTMQHKKQLMKRFDSHLF